MDFIFSLISKSKIHKILIYYNLKIKNKIDIVLFKKKSKIIHTPTQTLHISLRDDTKFAH